MRNSSGQMLVETILIMALLLAVFLLLVGQFRSNELAARLVTSPWVHLSGLIQNGVWGPPSQSMLVHPENVSRQRSERGDDL